MQVLPPLLLLKFPFIEFQFRGWGLICKPDRALWQVMQTSPSLWHDWQAWRLRRASTA
jgi:hypothetical protein